MVFSDPKIENFEGTILGPKRGTSSELRKMQFSVGTNLLLFLPEQATERLELTGTNGSEFQKIAYR